MGSVMSLFFYLVSFSIATLLLYYGGKRNNKVIIGISLLIPTLIGGLRYDVGTDYSTYVSIYDQLASLSLSEYLALENLDIEIGFYLLIKLSHLITGNYLFLLLASSLLTIAFFYFGLRKFKIKHEALVYFLFLTIIFPFSFNGIRQAIAVSICFFAFHFIIERVPKKFILWIAVASLFHKSALFLLPFYFINRIVNKNKKGLDLTFVKVLLLAGSLYVVLPYSFQLLQTIPFFEKYIQYKDVIAEGNNYIFYLKIVILSVILLFYRRIIAQNKINIYLLVFVILDIVLSTLGFVSPFIKRIALYFTLFSPLLLVSLSDVFSDRLGKSMTYALLILYGLLYFYIAYYLMGQSDIFPYRFIPWSEL